MKSAREKFKQHKAVVITGPKGCGSTRFALNLLSSIYAKNQCVVLTEASDWKHVNLGEVSVIVIDEFAGKVKYNTSFAESWLHKFDLIYAAVVQGKLNVIVTCETARFAKVLKTYSGHALLNHQIKLPDEAVAPAVVNSEENGREFPDQYRRLEEYLPECRLLLTEMMQHEDSWPFLEPVNYKHFPTYRKHIKYPMDFGTMDRKLRDRIYQSRKEFANDAKLISDNCQLFFEDASEVGKCEHNMRKFFNRRWKSLVMESRHSERNTRFSRRQFFR